MHWWNKNENRICKINFTEKVHLLKILQRAVPNIRFCSRQNIDHKNPRFQNIRKGIKKNVRNFKKSLLNHDIVHTGANRLFVSFISQKVFGS